jgi:acyl-CoA thioesterase-1
MTARRMLLPLLAWLALAPLPALAQDPPGNCGVPPEFLDQGSTLPRTARAMAGGQLRLLTIGSASALGPGNSSPATAWPRRMAVALEARQPNLKVELTTRAERGSTAPEQAALLGKALAEQHFDLVVWQTGTVEAVRGTEPQEMAEAVEAGIARAQGAGAEVVLMDQQFSRFLRANTQIDAYRDALRLVASAREVPLLRRYELMRLWAESDRIDLERTPKAKQAETWDRLHDCLGRALARMVLRAAAPP